MESPPAFCTVTETIADLANAKIAQGYIPAPYHRHEAVANTMPEQPTMPECLQYSPDQHTETGDAYKISSTSLPTTNTTSLLGSPNRSTGMEDTSKTSAATLRQSAEEVVLHPTTTSSATCPGRAQTSLPTMRHLVPQATRASPDNTCGSHISCCLSSTVIDMHLRKDQMHVSRCSKLLMSFCLVEHDLRFVKDCPRSKHYHALSSLASSVAFTFANVANAHIRKYPLHGTRSLCSV